MVNKNLETVLIICYKKYEYSTNMRVIVYNQNKKGILYEKLGFNDTGCQLHL